MTIAEMVSVTGLFITLLGIFIRYGVILPMKNVIQPLEISITQLRDEIANNKKVQDTVGETLQEHNVRISLQERDTSKIDKRVGKLEDRIGGLQK